MKPMNIFDLHCDTALAMLGSDFSALGRIRKNELHIDLERASNYPCYAQCFACFTTPFMMDWMQVSPEMVFAQEIAVLKKELEEKTQAMQGMLDFVKQTMGETVQEVKLNGDLGDSPACVTPGSGMSFEMEKYMRRVNPEADFPAMRILELNPEHEAVKAMQSAMVGDTQKARDYANLLYGQALLMADLPIEDPAEYTDLVCKLMR